MSLEMECLLADMEMGVRAERDRIQGVLDHQAEFPNDQYDPDEYLEGAVKALDWVLVDIQRRIVELK
jgi:hypothetical protein